MSAEATFVAASSFRYYRLLYVLLYIVATKKKKLNMVREAITLPQYSLTGFQVARQVSLKL